MLTGTHKNAEIADELDCDGELSLNCNQDEDWLDKDMALDVIKHISKVFGMDMILEAAEKYGEKL